jgi:hypothetical protein
MMAIDPKTRTATILLNTLMRIPPFPQPDAGLFFTLSVYRNPRASNLQSQPVNLQFCKVERNRGRKKKHLEILGVFKCLHRTFKH